MTFIRTVNGDVPVEDMGVTYSHEHIIIEEGFPTHTNPDFLINDVGRVAEELDSVFRAGGRTMIDTMPANSGRNVLKLAEVSRLSGIHIVAPTGIHLEVYYPSSHWRYTYDVDELAELFIADIEEGIDARDYNGPLVNRTAHRAGLIKLATGDDYITEHQEKIFRAVAQASLRTGAPILTHTNAGQLALEQVERFLALGVDLSHVVICHVDRLKDVQQHRDLLQSGVYLEYDSAFRWKDGDVNWTYRLLEELLPDFPNQITVGMDAARYTYWRSYGGRPGLDFLLTTFRNALTARGLGGYWSLLMVQNPAAVFGFSNKKV
jgi:predicted metal-dependent phosphotriesterase family hydrolase